MTKNAILEYIDSGTGTRDSLGAEAPGAKAAELGTRTADPGSRVEIKPLQIQLDDHARRINEGNVRVKSYD